MKRFALFAVLVGLLALPLAAQIPTGTLSGHVTDGKDALPGVSVTISSPNLQGTRTAITGGAGDYIFKFVPAGEYRVKFELQGFTTLDTTCKVNAASEAKVDAVMPMTQVAEELTVTGSYETISTAGTASTTMEKSLIDALPIQVRNIQNVALLTAGVVANPGASNAVTIAGAVSYENLIMVNGVQIQDNVRGTPTNLYIEDAVQETTTSVSSVSAEYGRFTGGVVNMLTKSGGNEFHASIRDTMTNDSWTAVSPLQTTERNDEIINQYEATLGGFILKDRLWFFASGRSIKQDLNAQTYITEVPYKTGFDEKRYEGKLTLAVTPNHRVVGSYLKNERDDTGYGFNPSGYGFLDLASIYDRSTPSELWAGNYTGVLTDNFFIEAQYSKKQFSFINSGSRFTDIERGTPVGDGYNFASWGFYNSPIFCGVCEGGTETRDNVDWLLKASWFLSSASAGSHDIVAGYDRFEDKRYSNNYQSGSGYFLYPDSTVGAAEDNLLLDSEGTPYPVLYPDSGSLWTWTPIFQLSKGNNFRTDSIFLNDKWRLNNNWTFNIGLRYDKNNGENADGKVISKDSNISPRLSATFDPTGSGELQFNASYARYVAGMANTAGDSSAAGGQPASLSYLYTGPEINTNCDPAAPTADTCLDSRQVIRQVYNWYLGLSTDEKQARLVYGNVPGLNVMIPDDLKSPATDEYTLGVSTRLGTKGSLRADLVYRKYTDFYSNVTNMSTGQVQDQFGGWYDIVLVENDAGDIYSRDYKGLHLSASYRFSDRFELGGNYTLSQLWGNFTGESGGSGPVNGASKQYPEYVGYKQYNPEGWLPADQRHRARVYAVYDILNSKNIKLAFSLMETYASGTPYSAAASIRTSWQTDPGYAGAPSRTTYYFSRRGEYRFPDLTRTDIALPFTFTLPALGADFQFFLEPRVQNVFNETANTNANTTVYTSRNPGHGLSNFNPMTDTPVECPQGADAATCQGMNANWQKGPIFGEPEQATTAATAGHYQLPRTYTISFGIRF